MKKRVLSIALAICLLLTLMPTTVFAANSDATALQGLLDGGGTVTLSKDYTTDTTLNVTNTITLDLNGHVIKMTGSDSVIKVESEGNLTLQDSNKTATHADTSLPAGGVITGGNANLGGGVYVKNGSFTMNGGTIANCISTSNGHGGGGVYVNGTFTMNGGAIKNCSATHSAEGSALVLGGAVYVYANTFTMTGGTIENCSAEHGGGVAVVLGGAFTMTGGTIKNCSSTISENTYGGGGVYNANCFTMSGGTIENCSANNRGGGVYSTGDFTMNDGAIRNCRAKTGGGMYIEKQKMTMNGGIIEDCTSTNGTSDAAHVVYNVSILGNGGIIKGTAYLGSKCTISTTSSDSYIKFYDKVTNYGTISSGVYYGEIYGGSYNLGTVSDTYYTVSFDLNGGSGSIPTQWFVNVSTAPALQPANPTKDGYIFAGWYNGDTKYDFTQSVTSNLTLTAKWVTTNVSTEAELKEAINAGATSIKLASDFNLSSLLNLTDKIITLDLNGHVLTGDIKLADSSASPQSILTLIDSDPTASHTDSSLPLGGVVKGDITLTRGNGSVSHLYANGGTVIGMTSLPSYAGGIFCTSDTPTVFKGYVGNYGEIHGGIFYGSIKESCIKEKTVTFMNGSSRYALEVVAAGNKVVAPISPLVKDGYQTFDGWYNGETAYTFGSSLSENITLTAKYGNPITYNISYNLDGGTATNQTTYNVESEAITLNNPKKIGYTFAGWSGTGLTGEDNMTVTIAQGSTGNRTYTAHYTEKNSYTVAFDTNGGSNISDKTSVKWTDKVLSGITNPTKDGWEFTGWNCGNVTVTADTAYCDLVTDDTTAGVTLVAQWKDITAPTGEISIGTNKWTEFLNNITFSLFFKDTQTVTITASDNSGEEATIEYLLSDKELTTADLDKATFTTYSNSFSINPDNEYVIYARLTDASGNAAYINSNGIVLDATAPVISGIEDGHIYCSDKIVTVTDNKAIASVTVNGNDVTLDANNQFTLSASDVNQVIIVTDTSGNESAPMIVKVNNGHSFQIKSTATQYWQRCTVCDFETEKKDIPEITIISADKVCFTQDCEFSLALPNSEITSAQASVDFNGLHGDDIPVTIENGVVYGTIPASFYADYDTKFSIEVTLTTTEGFKFGVSKDVEIQKEHSGGFANCLTQATCDTCGVKYGSIGDHSYTVKAIKPESVKSEGTCIDNTVYYYSCVYCNAVENNDNHTFEGSKVADNHTDVKEWIKNETQHKQQWKCCGVVVIDYENHTWENGVCSVCNYTCAHNDNDSNHLCDYCGKSVSEHNYVSVATAPTCTEQGYTTYTCSVCGNTFRNNYVNALGHSFGDNNIACAVCGVANPNYVAPTPVPTPTPAPTPTPILALTENVITNTSGDKDFKGSSYAPLKLRQKSTSKTSNTITWSKVTGADGYIIYAVKCGSKLKKVKTTKATTYTHKKLKKGTYYKYVVVAYKNVDGKKVNLAVSKMLHIATQGGKYGNAKAVKTNKSTISIKKGKTFVVKASNVKKDKAIKQHRGICFESSNKNIATVNSKGKIVAKKKGKCKIYVYAQNGISKTISVTVK